MIRLDAGMPATLFRDSARSAERGAAVSEGATAASQGSNASPSREARGATSTVRINNSTDSGGGDAAQLHVLIKRLRRERAVLKRAVIEEQERGQALQANVYSLAKSKRRGEAETRAHSEEIDRLGFANEQLKRRINQMMKEFKDMEDARARSSANGGGGASSMLERLIGAGVTEEVDQLRAQIEVLQDELAIKIKENECVHIKQFELTQEHDEQIAVLRRRLKAQARKREALKAELESKQRMIDDLAGEKDDRAQEGAAAQESLERARQDMARRFQDMALANAALQSELSSARTRLRTSVPFDDRAVARWSVWTVPPHEQRKVRDVSDGMERVQRALAAVVQGYVRRSELEARLLRARSHHPDMRPRGGVSDDDDGGDAVENENCRLRGGVGGAGAGDSSGGTRPYERAREDLLIRAAKVAASLVMPQDMTLTADAETAVTASEVRGEKKRADGRPAIFGIIEALKRLVDLERQLVHQYEVDDGSDDDGTGTIGSDTHPTNKEHKGKSSSAHRAMRSALNVMESILQGLQHVGQALQEQPCGGGGLRSKQSNSMSKIEVVDQEYGDDAGTLSAFHIAVHLFASGDLGPNTEGSDGTLSFVDALPGLASRLARALRARAASIANKLVVEQRTPFLPKTVRSLLDALQGAEFDVATSAERLSEEIRRVGKTSGMAQLKNEPISPVSFSSKDRPADDNDVDNTAMDASSPTNTNVSAVVSTMRTRLSRRGRAFHRWGRQLPMSATLPHVHAVKYRNELEAERARVAALSCRMELMERNWATEREEAAAKLAVVQGALDRCVVQRDELQVENSRAREERSVAELSWKETERQLRAKLAKYRQRRNRRGKSGDSDDNSDSETKDHQRPRELNLPWGIGIDGGGDGDDSTDDHDHFHNDPQVGTPNHAGSGDGGLRKNGLVVSSPSSIRKAGEGGRQTPQSLLSASRTTAHTNTAGRARYTMHILDTEGIVRGLNSLRQNRSVDEQTREERLTQHYEAMLASRDMHVVAADDEAVKALRKYKLSLSKLQKLIRASQEHERSVRDSNERVRRAKEELAATREAMGAQSVMLSQRVMELEERGADSAEMVDRLANNEARCVHCHGWNRIGRIIGRVGEDMKLCLHCNRNPGIRSLNDEA